jgi:hypothetical protein
VGRLDVGWQRVNIERANRDELSHTARSIALESEC